MLTLKSELEADLAAAQRLGAQRIAVPTEKAIAALELLGEKELRNAAHVMARAKAFLELAKKDIAEVAKEGRTALTNHLVALRAEEEKFWEAFHGQPVRGVEILRAKEPAPAPKPTEEVKP